MNASTKDKTIFPYEVAENAGPEIFISGSYAEQSRTASHNEKRIYLNTSSSTSKHILDELLRRSVDEIFASSKDEEFEYGYESNFSLQLDKLIQRHGVDALREIQNRFSKEYTNPDLIVEALHTLGRSQHQETQLHRLIILLSHLQAALPVIRCGAALGIAYLDDPQALPTLKRALAQETSQFVKVCFQRVLEQLEETERSE